MTIVKICGLRSVAHALAAVAAGADLLGLIFAPARRQVSPEQAAAIAGAVRAATARDGRRVGLVGVFVNETPARMEVLARQCTLDALQLSGDEDVDVLGALSPDRMVIKAVRLTGTPAEQGWLAAEAPHLRLLVDAHVAGSYGGAGVLADWDRAADLARQRSVILAGGLRADNVAAAIARVRPWGVDVSSGVETAGVKDTAKIRSFVAAVRAADQQRCG
jgi:phosphoribosylanthranilate isomerase